ncbi:MAG: response regulator [Treponema sp.]|nr:response regulator [Treponema sp.]
MSKQKNKAVIILVDDNKINLTIGETVLAEQYIVVTASSAEEMFRILDNIIPAMILLDIEMPEMDGYEAVKNLKSKPQTKDIPVIFLTGRTEPSDKEKGMHLGAVDYIKKPYQPDFLFKRVEYGLKRYRATPKVRSFLYHSVSSS